jgi:hypothetical protein
MPRQKHPSLRSDLRLLAQQTKVAQRAILSLEVSLPFHSLPPFHLSFIAFVCYMQKHAGHGLLA